jgi:hypothetical protein
MALADIEKKGGEIWRGFATLKNKKIVFFDFVPSFDEIKSTWPVSLLISDAKSLYYHRSLGIHPIPSTVSFSLATVDQMMMG